MLSGILSIVPNTTSGEMIEELGNQLRAKQAIIPAQICYIVVLFGLAVMRSLPEKNSNR